MPEIYLRQKLYLILTVFGLHSIKRPPAETGLAREASRGVPELNIHMILKFIIQ